LSRQEAGSDSPGEGAERIAVTGIARGGVALRNVGLTGVGVMGKLIAQRILRAGHRLRVFDLSEQALAGVAAQGAAVAASPAAVAADSEVVLMSLPGPKQVEQVVTGSEGLLTGAHSGMIIVDLSTVDPDSTRAMAAAAEQKGVSYLDAPVLGRPASAGEWSLPVGGDPASMALCLDVLRLLARNVLYIGPSGSGNKVKLLNQMMFSAINSITAEMMAASEKIGIPPELLYRTISASQAATVSGLFKELGQRVAEGNYEDPTFHVDLLSKDVSLAISMARAAGAAVRVTALTQEMNELAQSRGLGRKDTSVMWQLFRNAGDDNK
jgi:3-hydroxyisobutyrate dehydrogenase